VSYTTEYEHCCTRHQPQVFAANLCSHVIRMVCGLRPVVPVFYDRDEHLPSVQVRKKMDAVVEIDPFPGPLCG